jgi:uncharacterized iron-regulated protein/outer membrane lipoprotein-sorting protein
MRIILLLLLLFCVVHAHSQSADKFAVYDSKGNPSSFEAIVDSLATADVLFLGEEHDDLIAHQVELEIFKQTIDKYRASRRVALSLEMFERDVQTILNEYLAGQITEEQFLRASRPWPRYKDDYRPLVELAREQKLDVIAANAPRRYINMVSRNGRESLRSLSKDAMKWLAPLPYAQPSDAYAKKFKALMASRPEAKLGMDNILSSQSLWDATMADAIARYLKKNKRALVVHLNGSFHTENRLGTVEHLLRYRKKTKALVVTMTDAADIKNFDKSKHTDLGDFVILTARRPTTPQPSLVEIYRRMKSMWTSLVAVRADVQMTRQNALLKEADTYKGFVSLTRPRSPSVRLDWVSPVKETLLLAGGQYMLYRPRLNQVLVGDASRVKSTPPRSVFDLLTMRGEQFKSNFNILFLGEERIDQNVMTWRLQFTPKNAGFFKSADAWVDADGMIRAIRVTENNSDVTTINLSSIVKNPKIHPTTFRLDLPKDVQVIRN